MTWTPAPGPQPSVAHVTTADVSLRFLLRNQLRAFRRAGFDVIGVSAPGAWVGDLVQDGVTHAAVPDLGRRWSPLADLRALLQLTAALRRLRPTIVHTHTPKAGVLGRFAARLAGVPIIVNTMHGFYALNGPRARRAFFLSLEWLAARASDFELSQSREDLEMLRRLKIMDPERSAYLGNGIDLRTFDPGRVDRAAARARLGISADTIVVGTVGRLVWEKGYREIFAMAEALRREESGVMVLTVGPVEEGKRDAVPAPIVDDLGRRGVVRFLGIRTDMPEVYAAMDVFVLASYREGFPRSGVEAAAMGLPLVLTDIRGCREVVQEGRNGFLVPVRDPERLAAAVLRLVRDPELRARLGAESRRRAVAEFDEERVIATTLQVYGRLLWEKHRVHVRPHQERTT